MNQPRVGCKALALSEITSIDMVEARRGKCCRHSGAPIQHPGDRKLLIQVGRWSLRPTLPLQLNSGLLMKLLKELSKGSKGFSLTTLPRCAPDITSSNPQHDMQLAMRREVPNVHGGAWSSFHGS